MIEWFEPYIIKISFVSIINIIKGARSDVFSLISNLKLKNEYLQLNEQYIYY